MRELGFSQMWDKLNNPIFFTTFRFPRKDTNRGRDWSIEETVKVVYKPRSPKYRKVLGVARIIRKEIKNINKAYTYYPSAWRTNTPDMITPEEAYEDGFKGMHGGGDLDKMQKFFHETYGYHQCNEPINKLTLYWINRENKTLEY